jgi:hypothetical protein
MRVSLGIHLVCGIVVYAMIVVPGAIELFAVDNAFKRQRGWDVLAAEVARLSDGKPYKAIMTDHRMVTAELLYYGRKLGKPVVVFDRSEEPSNEFELKAPYRAAIGGPVLYVTFFGDTQPILSHFTSARQIEIYRLHRGGKQVLDFALYDVDGYKG